MKTIGTLIKEARERAGLTQPQLASLCGWESQGRVSNYEKDIRQPKIEDLKKLALVLKVSMSELIGEELASNLKNNTNRIPIVGMAQLGDGGHWLAYDHPDSYVQWYSDDPNAYAVQGIGDSMQPRIKHKEFVIIEPSHPIMNGDEVFVVTVDGRRMVKIYSYTKDDRVHLESENKEHEKIILDKSEVLFMHYVTGIAKSSKMYV